MKKAFAFSKSFNFFDRIWINRRQCLFSPSHCVWPFFYIYLYSWSSSPSFCYQSWSHNRLLFLVCTHHVRVRKKIKKKRAKGPLKSPKRTIFSLLWFLRLCPYYNIFKKKCQEKK